LQIFKKKLFFIVIFILSLIFPNAEALTAPDATFATGKMPEFKQIKGPTDALKESTGADVRADEFDFVGDNMIAKKNVFVRKGDLILYSDMLIVNNTTKNVELSGNVKFYTLITSREEMEYWELEALQKNPYAKLKVVGTVLTPSGRQMLVVDVIMQELSWSGNRAAGNLKNGIFQFGKFVSKFGNWYALGDNGVRFGNGKFVMDDATITPCQSIVEGNTPVFSLESARLVAFPPAGSSIPGKERAKVTAKGSNLDDYHFWGYSNVLYIGAIPVLWLPVVYKPPRGDMGKWGINVGSNTDWGFYVQTTNYWDIIQDEDVSLGTTNMIDYYGRRGWAFGNQTELYTKDTKTEFFVYGQMDQYHNMQVPDNSRFGQLNSFRYALQLKNISNITDRMAFRGNLAKLSDMYYLYDFFNDIAAIDPQPATYGSLNYQFDPASVNLLIRPRINNFFSVVESLPRLDITVPRQELFENIYFQSETSIGYYNMKWRDFSISRSEAYPGLANDGPTDYGTFRFDTVNFLYYPLKLDWLNVLPRAGLRMTAYGNSSSADVSTLDLNAMIAADAPEGTYSDPIKNYNSDGGGKFRIIPEFGIQFDTKISRSWDDVKNAYFDFNGLRHVMQPYVNYTFINTPTVSREQLYFFDDVDRIDAQNWVRLGLENHLQTRRGSWGNSQVYTWASMENYVDLIFNNREFCGDGWKNLGGLGTLLNIKPSENLTFDMQFLIEGSKIGGSTDLMKSIDKASFIVDWDFAENWGISCNYYYGNERLSEGVYSMGSNLSTIQAGSVFLRNFSASNYVNTNLDFQINERTAGKISIQYDFDQKLMPSLNLSLIRSLPCGLEFMAALGISTQNNTSGEGTQLKQSLSFSLGFTPSSDYIISPRENLLPENITRTPGF